MKNKVISVVIPTHNSNSHILKCLDSVLMQSYGNLEIIIVDDNSKDDTKKLINEFLLKDSRIRLIEYKENVSAFVCRKRGILEANGQYILFVDSDDYISRELCEEIIEVMNREAADILGFRAEIINCGVSASICEKMETFAEPYCERLTSDLIFKKCFVEGKYGFNLWNKLFSAELCKNVVQQLDDEKIFKANDLVLYFFLALSARSYYGYRSEGCYYYCYGKGDTGKKKNGLKEFERYCNYSNVLAYMKKMSQRMGVWDGQTSRAMEILEARLLDENCMVWAKNLEEEIENNVFDQLAWGWKPAELVETIWHLFFGHEREIVKKIINSNVMKPRRNNIKTIALYYFKLNRGGVERVVSLLAPIFLKMGYSVILITDEEPVNDDYEIPQEVRRYIIPSTRAVCDITHCYYERGLALCKIFENEKVDVLCYQAASSPILFYDLVLTKLCKVEFILSKHELFSQSMVRSENRMLYDMSVYQLTDYLIVLSQAEQLYWRILGINAHYIPNPNIEINIHKKRTEEKIIVWVGRLDRFQKRYQDIVPIMQQVIAEEKDAKIKIFGSGETYEDVDLLKSAVKSSGLEKHIEYCGYTTELDMIYGDAMIHMVTSAYESFPMTVFESRVYGIPLVTYNMPYLELLKDGKGCIVVEQGDYEGAAAAIIRLLRDSELRAKYSSEAVCLARQFSNQTVFLKWKEVFENAGKDIVQTELDDTNDTLAVILKTMAFHYSLGNEQALKNKVELKTLRDEKWVNEIKLKMINDNLSVVIYPFGDVGKSAKKLLNDNGIQEAFVIDNKLAQKDNTVKKIKDLETMDCTKYLFVICSNKASIYDEVRDNLLQYADRRNVYDLYPRK